MFKKYKYSKNINFDNIFNSSAKIGSFEFKKYSKISVTEFLNDLIEQFGFKDVSIVYNIDYRGFEDLYSTNIDLDKYTGFDIDSKYVKEKIFFTYISQNENILSTNSKYNYLHILNHMNTERIIDILRDRIELKFSNIIFLHIKEDLLLYPNDEMGFGLIDVTGKNTKLFNDIMNLAKNYNISLFLNY